MVDSRRRCVHNVAAEGAPNFLGIAAAGHHYRGAAKRGPCFHSGNCIFLHIEFNTTNYPRFEGFLSRPIFGVEYILAT